MLTHLDPPPLAHDKTPLSSSAHLKNIEIKFQQAIHVHVYMYNIICTGKMKSDIDTYFCRVQEQVCRQYPAWFCLAYTYMYMKR